MKIEGSSKSVAPPLKDVRSSNVKQASASEGDNVQLSAVSTQLLASNSEPAFDAARVAEIKQAIAEGRFSIDSGAIADRLIASAKEFIAAKPQG